MDGAKQNFKENKERSEQNEKVNWFTQIRKLFEYIIHVVFKAINLLWIFFWMHWVDKVYVRFKVNAYKLNCHIACAYSATTFSAHAHCFYFNRKFKDVFETVIGDFLIGFTPSVRQLTGLCIHKFICKWLQITQHVHLKDGNAVVLELVMCKNVVSIHAGYTTIQLLSIYSKPYISLIYCMYQSHFSFLTLTEAWAIKKYKLD